MHVDSTTEIKKHSGDINGNVTKNGDCISGDEKKLVSEI
jgi:hypothetical protein